MLTVEPLEGRALLSTFTVSNTNDSGTGSLRQAILDANAPGADTINFAPGLTGTITLNSALPALSDTTGLIHIEGPGAKSLTVARSSDSGTPDFRIFTVDSGADVKLVGLTITGGLDRADSGGGIYNAGMLTVINSTIQNSGALSGGGIYNSGALTVTNCTMANNGTAFNGGGIFNRGTVTVTDTTISGSSTGFAGGGIFSGGVEAGDRVTMTVTNCTISGNTAGDFGGGILVGGTATIIGTTISGNHSTDIGGGIENEGTLTVTDCTISGNTSDEGGGIFNRGPLMVTNSTIAYNSAGSGGGIFSGFFYVSDQTEGFPTLSNTIVALNTNLSSMADDVAGPVSSSSANNLIGTGGSGGLTNGVNGNQVGVVDPGLGTLADNGGPTQTIALLPGSPAIDTGSNALAADPTTHQPLTTDQRGPGFPRIVNDIVDIGAFEVQAVAPSVTCTVADSLLWPPNHNLVNVGLGVVVDPTKATLQLQVYANDGATAADAADIGPDTLRLRAERQGGGQGRVYLIVATATNASGQSGFDVCTVVVPHDQSAASLAKVKAAAAAAEAYYRDHHTAPTGYALLGEGPVAETVTIYEQLPPADLNGSLYISSTIN